jgi:hypothetical protein
MDERGVKREKREERGRKKREERGARGAVAGNMKAVCPSFAYGSSLLAKSQSGVSY